MGFSASLSGLNAQQQALTVVGNNLANINTVAFKSSDVAFSDLVSQSVGGSSANPMQVGLGVALGSISPNFGQGGINSDGVPTHAAIQGSGFFVIGSTANRSYTRAGNFSFDATGMLVTPDGKPVQGYTAVNPATGAIINTGQPANIVVPPGVLRPPTATTQFGSVSNLDAGAKVGDTFTSSVQIFDSLGVPHVVTTTYTNTATGAWNYSITVPGPDIAGGVVGVPKVLKAGTLTFDPNGVLKNVDGVAAANVAIPGPVWADGSTAGAMTWTVFDVNKVATLSGFAAPSSTSSITQDGATAGSVSGVSIDSSGQIMATLGAGKTVAVGQLAIANFNNPQGLVKAGSNQFGESATAGAPNIGSAGTGGRGTLIGSALESSNVDIATEFSKMILAQRGYQANSKGITVADELFVSTLQMKS
jgi:flagellar hook protein FlgE